MIIRALALAKGSTNVASTDVIGIRVGVDYASARELVAFQVGGTNVMSGFFANVGPYLPSGDGLAYIAASSAASGGVLLFKQEVPASGERLWIRRNSAAIATGVLTMTSIDSIYSPGGKFRTGYELNQIMFQAHRAGAESAMRLGQILFED